jgi:(1->4)-alpha-D-glucan 1-alpha-D-glucosylmutase
MVSELNVLAHRLSSLSERSRHTRDFTLNGLRHALVEMLSCFPIYRTYVRDGGGDERDRAFVQQAYEEARSRTDEFDLAALDFLRDILLMRPILGAGNSGGVAREHLAFVMKLQQFTGPVMAKGLEDTAFYVYNRLVSLNEVGGEPERFGVSVDTFHRTTLARARRWPASLLATSTHDTKRSEDVRARIDALSELPDAWDRFLMLAREANEPRKARLPSGRLAPDAVEEVLFYQTLLGAAPRWPPSPGESESLRTRLVAYMCKAVKEAKVNDSWTSPDPEYAEAIRRFIQAVFEAPEGDTFHEELRALHRRVARVGRSNAIAQQLLKIASPGVPDVYQGTELFELSLVDPDNRRPVDYALRARLLDDLDREAREGRLELARELAHDSDDRLKLYVTATALRARRAHPALFATGDYVPLVVVGARARHVVAFARVHGAKVAIALVPRLVAGLQGDREAFAGTFVELPDEIAAVVAETALVDAFTGVTLQPVRREGGSAIDLQALLSLFPVSLLVT